MKQVHLAAVLNAELLENSRKTECGAKQFLTRFAVRAAPFTLLSKAAKGARGLVTSWQ